MGQMQLVIQHLLELHTELLCALHDVKPTNKLIGDPTEAAKIAHVFSNLMGRFFLYEEYGAKYEDMLRNMAAAAKNIPNWESYQRGFETLTKLVAPKNRWSFSRKKSLTFNDLHIKVGALLYVVQC
jgi:hypothetical protein